MKNLLILIATATLMIGCAAPQPVTYSSAGYGGAGGSYGDRGGCRTCGEVVSVDRVAVEAQGSGTGAVLGAIIGGVLGNQIGGGSGRKVATGAGIVAGAVVGNEIEKGNNRGGMAYQVVMRMDDGRRATVVQADHPRVRPGDRAFIENERVYRIRDN